MNDKPLFDFSNDKNHDSCWSFTLPEAYTGIRLPGAGIYTLNGGFGYFTFQGRVFKNVSIWLNNYLVFSRMKGRALLDLPMIEMSFVLGTKTDFEMNSLGKMMARGWQFNIVYDTHMDAETQFEKGAKIVTVDIHYQLDVLEGMNEYYPDLFGPLLDAIHAGRPMKYFHKYIYASPDMVKMFKRLFHALSNEYGSASGIEVLAVTLLLEGLKLKRHNKYMNTRFDYVLHDKRVATEAIKLLKADAMDFRGNQFYAEKFAMGQTRFKTCFFDHTGTTLKANWLENRIVEAVDLLVNTNERITQIALECGFASVFKFNEAIRKYLHMEAWQVRRLAQGESWIAKKDRC
ncbi:AraC-type DNA-binding protein [Arachidicoccus rhizosphaerae]|uniref:AraC-type DNA-binding protein n=1 Tax=Arachidicoccus rhizosphaerae TaxID=551991 RepID=A0A1H3ZVQ7_9BACT|nr:helix-turn-helix domain-containing protein [Arachidicoccus rhizosphaerae]SEA27491.1 AraC-type DNA-binding protein [Arachidicoccus rhizosphaerae]